MSHKVFGDGLSRFGILYRPGYLNWDFWIWIFHSEELYRHSDHKYVESISADYRRSKTAILTILQAVNFEYIWITFTLENVKNSQKFKIQSCSNDKNGSLWVFQWPKLISYQNLIGRKILKFPNCVFPIRLPRSVQCSKYRQYFQNF